MPYRRLPNNITAVLRTLINARDAWINFPTARLISASHWAKLDPADLNSFLNRFAKEVGDVDAALALQAPLTNKYNRDLARLTLFVSHFHQVYDFGVVRGDFTAGGRAYYGRDVSNATLPDLSTHAAVLEAARLIPTGETKRLAAEGAAAIPMSLPSAAQVATLLAQVELEAAASQKAQAFTDQQQNEVGTLYPEAQKLAVSLCNTIEFNLSERAAETGLDASGQRRIARDWGVVYIYNPTETPDEGDTNAANTTLPPPPAIP